MIRDVFTLTVTEEQTRWVAVLSDGAERREFYGLTPEEAREQALARLDRDVWRDAWRIAWIGAANPTAVAGTIQKWCATFTRLHSTNAAKGHPAVRCMVGQLAFLCGQALGPDGASMDVLEGKVKEYGF